MLALVVAARRDPQTWTALESRLSAWLFVAVLQGAIGYLQYFTGVPELLVGAHLAGATGLWVVTLALMLDVLGSGRRPVPVAAAAPVAVLR